MAQMKNVVHVRLPTLVLGAVLFASIVHGQDSRFHFDASGNLTAQTAASTAPPQILGQPHNQVVAPGQAASFSVVAADTRDLSYQWRFDNLDIIGATGPSLLLHDISIDDEGPYTVVLTNPSGSVTSAPALLMLDTDGDGMGDSWEQNFFGSLAQYPMGDADGDGVSNSTEFVDDTDPTNSASAIFRLTLLSDGGNVIVTPNRFRFTNGENVTLTATAVAPHAFHAWGGDVDETNNPLTLTITSNTTVFAYLSSYDLRWGNGVDGNWHARENWSPRFVPASNDHVIILNGRVTNNAAVRCRQVTLGGPGSAPTLLGSGTLAVLERCDWLGGTLEGTGRTIVEPGATLNAAGGTLSVTSGTLENRGTVLWTIGNLRCDNSVISNRAGAVFDARGTVSLIGVAGNPRFHNEGTFRKSVSAGAVSADLSFNNHNTVEIQTGTFVCTRGLLNNGAINLAPGTILRAGGGSASGSFNVSSTALAEWTGFTLNPGAQLNGVGLYRINNGRLSLNTAVTVNNLDFLAGTLSGPGALIVSNAMTWRSGTMDGGGRTIIAPGATLDIDNPSGVTLYERVLENGGTILWTGHDIVMGAAVITNRPGALFHAQTAAAIRWGLLAGNRFDNAGTFLKSGSAGATTISGNVNFNNYNTLDIQTGTFLCADFLNNGSVTLAPGTTKRVTGAGSARGSFNVPATALLEWNFSQFTLHPGAQLNGDGLYRVTGASGRLTCNANLSVANVDLMAYLSGTGALTVRNAMNWPSGTMDGGGRTIIAPGATLNINNPSSVSLATRTLENGGTTLWTGASIEFNGAVITNRPGALFHAQNAASLAFIFSGNRFDNAGTFRKSANTGTTTIAGGIPFNNFGTIELQSGILAANGGYTSSSNALLRCGLSGTTPGTGHGQLRIGPAVNLSGLLAVDLLNGYLPATNSSFTLLTANSRSGVFARFDYPVNAVAMQVSYTPNSVVAEVTEIIPPPVLFTPELAGPNVILTWTARSNAAYRLEFNPGIDLSPSNWTGLPGDITSLSNVASKLDPFTRSNRLYRVRVLP